jgi:hypothetical protein
MGTILGFLLKLTYDEHTGLHYVPTPARGHYTLLTTAPETPPDVEQQQLSTTPITPEEMRAAATTPEVDVA